MGVIAIGGLAASTLVDQAQREVLRWASPAWARVEP